MRERIDSTRVHVGQGFVDCDWPGFTVPVRNLYRILAGTASDHGADLRTGYSLASLTPTGAARLVSEGDEMEVRARVVVGCDGPSSAAARLLGLEPQQCLQVHQCEVLLLSEARRVDLIMDRRLRGGYAWIFPRRTTASLGVASKDTEQAPALLEWLRETLLDRGLIGPQNINRTSGLIPCGGIRRTLRVGHVILAGDAAGTAHPLAVSGICPAIGSGAMAGRAAVAHVGGDGEALRLYERDMHRWLDPIHSRALDRRRFLEDAWDRIDFSTLVRDTCL
jgi:flavin-dependent dehydrogenase